MPIPTATKKGSEEKMQPGNNLKNKNTSVKNTNQISTNSIAKGYPDKKKGLTTFPECWNCWAELPGVPPCDCSNPKCGLPN